MTCLVMQITKLTALADKKIKVAHAYWSVLVRYPQRMEDLSKVNVWRVCAEQDLSIVQ